MKAFKYYTRALSSDLPSDISTMAPMITNHNKCFQTNGRDSVRTVCPGSSDPPEKIFNKFASENEVYTIRFNYYDTLG